MPSFAIYRDSSGTSQWTPDRDVRVKALFCSSQTEFVISTDPTLRPSDVDGFSSKIVENVILFQGFSGGNYYYHVPVDAPVLLGESVFFASSGELRATVYYDSAE